MGVSSVWGRCLGDRSMWRGCLPAPLGLLPVWGHPQSPGCVLSPGLIFLVLQAAQTEGFPRGPPHPRQPCLVDGVQAPGHGEGLTGSAPLPWASRCPIRPGCLSTHSGTFPTWHGVQLPSGVSGGPMSIISISSSLCTVPVDFTAIFLSPFTL